MITFLRKILSLSLSQPRVAQFVPPSLETRPPPGIQPDTLLTFDETVAQLYRGYENSQRVVQFMDAKSGAVIALCLAIFVLTGKLVVWVHDRLGEGMLISHQAPVCFMVWGMTALVAGVGICGFITLHFAFRAVRPNGLPAPEHFTALFPAGKDAWKNPLLVNYMERVVNGQKREFVLNEFQHQLLAMGSILYLKIESLRSAIRALWWQGFFSFFLLIFLGLVVGLGWYPKKAEQPPKPLPITIVAPN